MVPVRSCGVGISERPESTIGYERNCNVFMKNHSRDEFITQILGSVPQFPDYYRRMKALNAEGAPTFAALPGSHAMTATEFRQAAEKAETVILDVRSPEAFERCTCARSP